MTESETELVGTGENGSEGRRASFSRLPCNPVDELELDPAPKNLMDEVAQRIESPDLRVVSPQPPNQLILFASIFDILQEIGFHRLIPPNDGMIYPVIKPITFDVVRDP